MKKDKIIIKKITQELVDGVFNNKSLSKILDVPLTVIEEVTEDIELDDMMDDLMDDFPTDEEYVDRCESIALEIFNKVTKNYGG